MTVIAAAIALLRYKQGDVRVMLACAVTGLALRTFF